MSTQLQFTSNSKTQHEPSAPPLEFHDDYFEKQAGTSAGGKPPSTSCSSNHDVEIPDSVADLGGSEGLSGEEKEIERPLPTNLELQRLKAENEILHNTLKHFRQEHPTLDLSEFADSYDDSKEPVNVESFCKQVQNKLQSSEFFNELLKHEKSRSAVFIAGDDHQDGCSEVGLIPNEHIHWWTLVPRNPDGAEPEYQEIPVAQQDPLDGPYVLIQETDVVEAVAEFVALCVIRMPETHNLAPDKMQGMILDSFSDLQEKGFFSNVWSWTSFTYNAYGYSSFAYNLYKEPAMARMILNAMWSCLKWAAIIAV